MPVAPKQCAISELHFNSTELHFYMSQPMKIFLPEDSLDFGLKHITDYYDTDFFPRTEEFLALKKSWSEVKQFILNSSLDEILTASPIVEPWPKTRGGFRVVHRLEPLDSIIYTAMAWVIASSVETSRASPEVACSYRIAVDDSSLFTDGSGFQVYRAQCETYAASNKFVLAVDIADFYNKIYLHRLQNAIQLAIDNPPGISKRIEYFLLSLNTKASQGIPIGPAASIVMAEATLIDVDKFIEGHGFQHVRYVDDFRIFGNSKDALEILFQDLCLYLHENQRLTLSSEKSKVLNSSDFIAKELSNQYQLEKLEILKEIEVLNPYR